MARHGGGGRIRTAEPEGADLQSAAFSHFATPPVCLGTIQFKKQCRQQESNPRPTDYKSVALPAELHRQKNKNGDPYGNRTRDTAVKGRCLNRLTNGPLAPQVGFEPTTYRLTAGCSTTELLRNK